jgi:hypothetical protein
MEFDLYDDLLHSVDRMYALESCAARLNGSYGRRADLSPTVPCVRSPPIALKKSRDDHPAGICIVDGCAGATKRG